MRLQVPRSSTGGEATVPYSEWTRYLTEFSPVSAVAAPPPDLYCATEHAVPVKGWDEVGDEQLAEFWRRGFLIVADAFQPSDVSAAADAIAVLLGGTEPSYRPSPWGEKHGVLLRPGRSLESLAGPDRLDALVLARGLVKHEPRLRAMAEHVGIRHFLERVMDDAPVLMHDMVRAKPPSPGDKPWHQDLTHFRLDPSSAVVTAWIAVDDAPLESGCLHFIPGSHLDGPAKHVFDRDYQIPDSAIPRTGQVAAPVTKGSCVLLHALVQHGSPPNRSTGRRLALQLTFRPDTAVTISDEERILAFADRPGG